MKVITFSIKSIILICGVFSYTQIKAQQPVPWKAPIAADLIKNPFSNKLLPNEKGKKIYTTICFVCHGDKGKGDGIGSIGLIPKPANFTSPSVQNQLDGAIFWKITTGRGAMASYLTTLTIEERWLMVNYIRQLGKGIKKNDFKRDVASVNP